MPGGELCVRTFRSAVGALNRPIKLFLEPASGLLVELLVSRTQAGEREPDLVGCIGDGVEQLLPRLGGGVRHLQMIALQSPERPARWFASPPDLRRGRGPSEPDPALDSSPWLSCAAWMVPIPFAESRSRVTPRRTRRSVG